MAGSTTAAAEAKTSVWWDINWCAVPAGCGDPHRLADNIFAALASAGCNGPVSVFAYGDASRVAPGVLEALSSTGISLSHVAAGVKDGVDKKMLVDMVFWAYDNPPPGNYLLISGDQDFSDLLHKLKMKKYEILLAHPPNVSSRGLFSAAKIVWLWESLAAGEPLLAKSPHSHTVADRNRNSDNLDASENFPALYNKSCDSNVKAAAKPIQIYIKKSIVTSTSASNEGQVEHVDRVSEDSAGSTASELDRSSVSSSSSTSESIEGAKMDQSSLLGTPTLSQSPAQKPAVQSRLHQMEISQRFITGGETSISTKCASRSGTLDGVSNGQYPQVRRQSNSSKAYVGDNNLKEGKECKVKPLQKYVKKTNIASSSSNQVESYVGSTRSESTVLSSSSYKSAKGAKVDHATSQSTSTLFQSSAQKPLASIRLHQVIAPQKSILGKKPITSTGHTSRDANHGPGVSLGHYHSTYQQRSQSSYAQNKLHSNTIVGDNNVKSANLYKAKQHQEYVRKTDISSSSASNEIHLGFPSNSKGSTLGLSSQSISSLFCSESLDGTNVNPLPPLPSAQKPATPTHSHQDGAEFIFGKKPSTSVEFTPTSGTFCFGASSGQYCPTDQQTQCSVLLKQDNSVPPNPHSAFCQSYSTNPEVGSPVLPSAGHNGAPSSQIQTLPSGSTFQGLADICSDMSRLAISECPTRLPSPGTPASMPMVSGHPRAFSLHVVKSSFHAGSDISLHPNHSNAPQFVQSPASDSRPPHPPNLSYSIQSPENHGETQESPPNSPEHDVAIRSLLHALGILKTEKLSPTESNIADCIRYGEMNLAGFDTKKALECAIRNQAVVMKKLVNDMPLFVEKDESLWKCVDVTNSNAKRPKALVTLRKFISSAAGYSALKDSQSRYQAATILKKLCFQQHALGDVLQILQIVIVRKKWLVPHSSGWQPLSFNRVAVDVTGDAIGEVTS
ncbi:uncharacterized protein LOC124696713 [Lolium rigidum]|uniref:uncharacterized protein LOC124696713 n=1 Tax=Lolium rigidum TaxID=89674 RepID=UPI001F5CF2DD|nr:uncharacterized protein LOC124696713 [Lolium rigidum]